MLIAAWVAVVELQARSPWLVLAAMAIVWIADIAAYFAGRAFGRRKLAPSISPGKTWEGVYGALVAVALYALALVPFARRAGYARRRLARSRSAPGWCSRCVLAALSVVGDLFESLLKRQAGVKDSGTLLPGHGGVLDRIDALLAAMPVGGARRARVPAMTTVRRAGDPRRDRLDRRLDARRRRAPSGPLRGRRARRASAMARSSRELCRRFRPQLAALLDPDAARALERALAADGLPTRVRGRHGGLDAVAALRRSRHGAGGDRRRGRARADARRGARRQADPAREQGGAGHRRRRCSWTRCATGGATLLPIDSEHNAIFQCLPARLCARARRRPACAASC